MHSYLKDFGRRLVVVMLGIVRKRAKTYIKVFKKETNNNGGWGGGLCAGPFLGEPQQGKVNLCSFLQS